MNRLDPYFFVMIFVFVMICIRLLILGKTTGYTLNDKYIMVDILLRYHHIPHNLCGFYRQTEQNLNFHFVYDL